MPKYYDYKVGNYYLYFTDKCIVEAFHVHASNKGMKEAGSAKFFVYSNGDTSIVKTGRLTKHSLTTIQRFIKKHHVEMYKLWSKNSDNGYYTKR